MVEIAGVLAPIPTPFTDDGSSISEVRCVRFIRHVLQGGIGGFVVCSEAGEFWAMPYCERKLVMEMVFREVHGGDLPILVNVSSMSTSASLDLAQHASRHGARAVVLTPPLYGPFTDDEVFNHYRIIAGYSDMSVICVDPFKRLTRELLDRLQQIGGTIIAEPISIGGSRTTSDGFHAGEFAVTALSLVMRALDVPNLSSDQALLWINLFEKYGSAKVVKAALAQMDFDLGPVRAPMMPLQGDNLAELRAVIATSSGA